MDFVIRQVHRMYYAEEGTALARFALFTKYCLLMGIPFVGWTIIEIFFCVLNNPLLFATVWVLLALIGAIAECFVASRGMSSTNNSVPHTVLGQVGLAAAPSNIYPLVFETDINNNRSVDIVQVNSSQARAVPDVGTQTPEITKSKIPTPDERSPRTPTIFSVRGSSGKTIPDVGTQTPQQDSSVPKSEKIDGFSSQTSKQNGEKPIQIQGIIATAETRSELDLANEFEIQEEILDAATTWILPPSKLESNKGEKKLRTEKNVFVDDGDPFLELNSVTNSEVLTQ